MEKKIIYMSDKYLRPWGNLRYQHGTPELPNIFSFGGVNETIAQDVRRGEIYDYEVRIGAGTYYDFSYTWPLTHDARVTFVPAGDGDVILNGGRKIEGWKETTVNGVKALMAEIPLVKTGEWNFTEFYVNKTPRRRPVYPKNGEKLRIASVTAHTAPDSFNVNCFVAEPGIFDKFSRVEDCSIEVLHYWLSELFPVESYDKETCTVHLKAYSRRPFDDDVAGGYAKYRINNVFESLSDPGEWFLDRKTGIIYYIPLPGETADNILAEAPVNHRLLSICGRKDRPVGNITFRDITFENTAYDPCVAPGARYYATYGQAAANLDGGITLRYAHHVDFENCTFRNIGNYAVDMGNGSSYNTVVGCEITGCGGGGIKVMGGDVQAPEDEICSHNRFENNLIHHCTTVDYCAIGIFIGHGASNRIAHNEIHDMKYSGVSVGWVWGMFPSRSDNNIIEYNHIYRCGDGDLSDMGGIYLLGPQGGTEVRGNHIHDIRRANYGGWGIYLDEGSTNVTVEKNVVYNCDSQAFFIHYGRENMVRYNIFESGKDGTGDGVIGFGAGVDSHFVTFMKNLLIPNGKPMYFGNYNHDFAHKWLLSDANFICTSDKSSLINTRYADMTETWDTWQNYGFDVFSLYFDKKDFHPTAAPAELLPYGFPADVDIAKAGIQK